MRLQYAVKIVCGTSDGTVVAPGEYWTAINVHNPTPQPLSFQKKIAIALPYQKAGPVSDFTHTELNPDEALEIDRNDIFKLAEPTGYEPGTFLKGFVVIENEEFELDVVAVYTAAERAGSVKTLHIEHVKPREI